MPRRGVKALAHEKFRRMRHCEHSRDFSPACLRQRILHQPRAESSPSNSRIHRQRANLRQLSAVSFERHATRNLASFFQHQKPSRVFTHILFRARQQRPFRGIMRDQRVNRGRIRQSRPPRSHATFSCAARRVFASTSASRTASGAVPPGARRRARDASSVSASAKSASNDEEYFFSRSTVHRAYSWSLPSASWIIFPIISCACRNGIPFATK